MKTSTFLALFVVGITYYASAQAGGGGGGAGGAGGGAAGASGGAAAPASSGSAANPAASGSAANPAASGSAAAPAASGSAANPAATGMIQSNQAATNQFGMNTNMQGSNNVSPTGAASGTNQMNNFVDRDDAVTVNDQELLVTVRQNVQAQLGITPTASMPVHFNINNGVVILIGFVPSADASQRILLLTQQTPGVTQVDNRLRVGTPPSPLTPATTTTPAFVGTTTDRGFSPSDRELLFKVQQQATKQLGLVPANGMQLPVHFSIQNGVVSIMGQVFSRDKKQQLLAAVQNTPGVVRVVDNVTVVAQGTPGGTVNNNLAPTSTGQSKAIFQNSTNVSR